MCKNFYNNFEEGGYFETTAKVPINTDIKFLGEYFHQVFWSNAQMERMNSLTLSRVLSSTMLIN